MGIFGKNKKGNKRLLEEEELSHEYEPPKISVIELFAEVDRESGSQKDTPHATKQIEITKIEEKFENAKSSSLDASPNNNAKKAQVQFQEQQQPSTSAYDRRLQRREGLKNTEPSTSTEYVHAPLQPPQTPALKKAPSTKKHSQTVNGKRSASLEVLGGYEEKDEEGQLPPQPLSKKSVFSSFSKRISSFSHLVRPQSFRNRSKNLPMSNTYDSDLDSPDILDHTAMEDDLLTLSTEGSRDTLSFTVLSQEGTISFVAANEYGQRQLEYWRNASHVSRPFIRIGSVLLASAVIACSFYVVAFDHYALSLSRVISAIYTISACLLIIILELKRRDERDICSEPSIRYQVELRSKIMSNANALKLVWGRGCLYAFAGSMALTIDHVYVTLPGAGLIFFGLLAFFIGFRASVHFHTLKTSFVDEKFLKERFKAEDSNRDGKINLDEFTFLVKSLGLTDLNDTQIYHIFRSIDVHRRRKVTFKQFKGWWLHEQSYIPAGFLGNLRRRVFPAAAASGTTPAATATATEKSRRVNHHHHRRSESDDEEHTLEIAF
mmetsp:Transcript_24280/g.39644  ORF Transcript_24280/g.39644 Transcript_24280/m.39644 type:complete len:549 (-) Transcript_24280:137-1783(-)